MVKPEAKVKSPDVGVEPSSQLVNTPGLTSADKIREAIRKEQASKKAAEQNITEDAIASTFKAYAERHSSKSTRTALMNTLIKLEGKTIHVAVPTLFIKEQVLHETDLIAEIRTIFHAEDLVLQVDVKKELFPEYEELAAIKTKLTSREIYQKMVTKNPTLKDLVVTLGLKPEGE
jgi:hypothetical protein